MILTERSPSRGWTASATIRCRHSSVRLQRCCRSARGGHFVKSTTSRNPALVFVHGGAHTGACWDETIAAIRQRLPDIAVFAPHLPGHGGVPGDLASLTIGACVDSVTDQIHNQLGSSRPIVLIGHSLAGIVLAGIAERLGAERIRHVVYVACCVPPSGQSVIDVLPFPLNRIVTHIVERSPVISVVPRWIVRYFFSNRATGSQRAVIRANICAESGTLLTCAPNLQMPPLITTTWILTRRDRALPPSTQRRFIRALGGVDNLVTIDAGHEVMITHPQRLAAELLEL